ncbi:MAG: site-2 protease family protein [bacterium]
MSNIRDDGEGKFDPEFWQHLRGSPFSLQDNGAPPRPRIWINIVLFFATVLTTMVAGALQSQGGQAFSSFRNLLQGAPFSAALLGILLAHEMGHYFVSRYHRVPTTLPYFIPMPTIIGTMGAIIRMRALVRDRPILFDIGIAGPLAGMCVAVPATVIGLVHSQVVTAAGGAGGIELGDSLLFYLLTRWIFGALPEGQTVLLHPVAFAGWLGFFVTSLNLLPMGQLDGGHVTYGLVGPRHRLVSRLAFLALIGWGVHGVFLHLRPLEWLWGIAFCWTGLRFVLARQTGGFLRIFAIFLLVVGISENFVPSTFVWLFWAVLITFLRLDHPPTRDVTYPLDRNRKILGWTALIVFVLTFTPRPFMYDLTG